jgi:hypothetical protein
MEQGEDRDEQTLPWLQQRTTKLLMQNAAGKM